MKTLYIIPGFGESTRRKPYIEISAFAKKIGFRVAPINIHWDLDKIMDDFVNEAHQKISRTPTNSYILGFSFGAYIASVLSNRQNFKGYIFCSLSPYFKTDLKHIPNESKKYFGKKLMNSFKKYSFPRNINSNAWFLVGDKDWSLGIKRTRESAKLIGSKNLIVLKNVGHDLNDGNYINEIKKIIKKL